MKKIWILSPLMLILASCNSQPETSSGTTTNTAQQTQPAPKVIKLTATEELAKYCRVCVLDRGEKMEEYLPSRLDVKHDGQTYKFCSEPCKKKFEANKKKYTVKQS
jgi:YHS domain-containing protein